MPNGCLIIDLFTRRTIGTGTVVGARSAARIAAGLAQAASSRPPAVGPRVPLTIRFEDLTGISDATVSRLTEAAATGLLTVEAAARLAMRHARESGASPPWTEPRTVSDGRSRLLDLEVAGDLFGEFALRVGPSPSGLIVGLAPIECLGRLADLFGTDGGVICIVSGRAPRIGSAAGIFSARHSAIALQRLTGSKTWRFAHHVLLIGGAALGSGHRRRAVVALLEVAIRRGGFVSLVSTQRRFPTVAASDPASPSLASEVLQLIEFAFPGLVVPPPAERTR